VQISSSTTSEPYPDSDSARVIWLSRRLLEFAEEQRDALLRGTLQQVNWLTSRMDSLMRELRELSSRARLSESEVAALKTLAAEFERVRTESERVLGELPEQQDSMQVALLEAQHQCGLGNTCQRLGRYHDAVAHYLAALAIWPEYFDAHNNLGNALHALHRSDDAVEHFRQAIAINPDCAEAHSNLGNALRSLNDIDQALEHYRLALKIRPDYPEAHNNLGNAFFSLHRYDEAMACYHEALRLNPGYALALNNLGTALQELNRFDEALAHHQEALRLDPSHWPAHQGLALLYVQRGRTDLAKKHGQIGFRQRIDGYPYRGTRRAVRALLLQSALGGNVITDDWLDDRVFQKTKITVDFCEPDFELPPHDLVINGIGEADRCEQALRDAAAVVARITAPVINPPSRVLESGRIANALRLGQLPGVVTPRIVLRSREWLARPGTAEALREGGFSWPLLLRSPGFHTGEHFAKVDRPDELEACVAALPGDALFAIEYRDTCAPDGMFRKYRVMTIGGQLYPLHVAVSAHWKVHYFSADMADSAAHRTEDAAFLEGMADVLGKQVMSSLAAIRDVLGLDYGGIDFGIDHRGRVVVFEANATMIVPPPAADERWAYRRAAVERINAAVRRMLLSHAGVADWQAA